MGSITNLVYYASVARGSTVLADHRKSKEDLADVSVVECLEKVPPFHNKFTYTVKQRMFIFLMDGPLTYCAIVDEALGKLKGTQFLEFVRDEFKLLLRSRGLDASRLERNALSADFAGVFKHLVKPLFGVPQKEVDLDNEHDLDSKDDTALSPPREPYPTPLTGNGGPPYDKMSSKHQVVQMREYMMTNNAKSLPTLDGGGSSSDIDGCGLSRKMKGRQHASRKWWRNVKLVLILDLFVCVVLFAIWLGICKGFKCVRGN